MNLIPIIIAWIILVGYVEIYPPEFVQCKMHYDNLTQINKKPYRTTHKHICSHTPESLSILPLSYPINPDKIEAITT